MSIASDMVMMLSKVIASQGISGMLSRPSDAPGTGIGVRFLMKHPGVRDEAIVNSYGVNAQIITLPHLPTFETEPPKKFDVLTRLAGDPLPYVFDAVVRREVDGVVVAWTAFVKGKGA